MKQLAIVAAVTALLVAAPLRAERPAPVFPFPVETVTLENGLRAYLVKSGTATDGMYLVIVTADAARLKEKLVRGDASPITSSASPKPAIAAEDRIIGALPLGVKETDVTILPIDRVFQ